MFGDLKIRRRLSMRSSILFASPELMHRPRSDFPLNFDIENVYAKFVSKNRMLAFGVCFPGPQPCLSAGRRFAASRTRVDYYPIGSFPQKPKPTLRWASREVNFDGWESHWNLFCCWYDYCWTYDSTLLTFRQSQDQIYSRKKSRNFLGLPEYSNVSK